MKAANSRENLNWILIDVTLIHLSIYVCVSFSIKFWQQNTYIVFTKNDGSINGTVVIFPFYFSELHEERYETRIFVENKLLNPIQTISLFSFLSPAKLSHFYTIIDGTVALILGTVPIMLNRTPNCSLWDSRFNALKVIIFQFLDNLTRPTSITLRSNIFYR